MFERLSFSAVLLVLASAAGSLYASRENLHDQEAFFYLTNPQGPAGDFAAAQMREPQYACVGQAVGLSACMPAATASVDPRLASLLEK